MSKAITLPRFNGSGYAAKLHRRGFEVVGRGCLGGHPAEATLVLAKPGSNAVVKVGPCPTGDPWPLYASRCLLYPGPFKPVIRHLAWHGTSPYRFFVATMDRLTAPDWTEHQALRVALDEWYRGLAAANAGWWGQQHDPELAKQSVQRLGHAGLHAMTKFVGELFKQFVQRLEHAGLQALAKFVRGLNEAFPDYILDLAPSNWMMDGEGRLVFIDPLARTFAFVPVTASRLLKA